MKTLPLIMVLALAAVLAGCAAPGPPSEEYRTGPRWENPTGIYDTGYRQWFDMPYYNPYAQ